MTQFNAFSPAEENMKPRVSELRRVTKVMFQRQVVIIGIVITLATILVAIIAPWIAPYDPIKQDLESIRQKPSSEHLLGTDEYGRDVMSRLIYGTRISLLVGVVAVCIAGVLGMLLGLIAGYFRGLVNAVIMRFIDALLALPPMVLMLAIAALLGGGLYNVLIALGISMMPTYCRLMCGQILALRDTDYVVAAHSIGASNPRVMFQHLLPNSFPPLLVLLTTNLGTAIIMEASLSFLGIGISPPTPTWGSMVNSGYPFLLTNPLMSIAPGLAIMLVVLAINMVGDGLRDALDPRLRGVF
jgi:peptide/nickel transport system permease protein